MLPRRRREAKAKQGVHARALLHELCRALLLSLLLILLREATLSRTKLAQQSRWCCYQFIQGTLRRSARDGQRLPVLVVDIAALPAVPVTPRKPLEKLIERLARLRTPPRAVALDIDFSPDEHGWLTTEDPVFFDICLAQQFPVYLGVHRTATAEPSEWLGASKYRRLAAAMYVQRDPREQWRWLRTSPGSELSTLGAALAYSSGRSAREIPLSLRPVLSMYQTRKPAVGIETSSFLPDYSRLERLKQESISYAEIMSRPEVAVGRAVIVGDVPQGAESADEFEVPARREESSGVLLHACVAHTLISAPLYELTVGGRLGMDLGLGIVLFGIMVGICVWRKSPTPDELPVRLRYSLRVVVLSVAGVIGMLFVSVTRVVWDDFILVACGFMFDEPGERLLVSAIDRCRRLCRRLASRRGPRHEVS